MKAFIGTAGNRKLTYGAYYSISSQRCFPISHSPLSVWKHWFRAKTQVRFAWSHDAGRGWVERVLFLVRYVPFLLGLEIIGTRPLRMFSIVALAYACIGVVSLILGTWIVGSWHLQSSIRSCVERKRVMRLVLILWSLALVVGMVSYMFLYTNS